MASKVKRLRDFKSPDAPGDYHRLVCMTGKNKGLSYFFSNGRIVLGRGQTSDIQVLDSKSSREHAELVLVGDKCILSDLESQNGIMVNDLKINQHALDEDDKIIIGSTVFKYNRITVDNQIPVEIGDRDPGEDRDKPKPSKRRIYAIAGILLAVVFLMEEPEKPARKPSSKQTSGEVDFTRKKRSKLDKDVRRKLGSIIHRGRRELREQNFFRAIEQFNLALIMEPGHGESSFLLKKSQQRLDEHIKKIANKARNETDQKKYRGALLQWCEIVRYLRDYPKDTRHKDALKQVEFLAVKLGYEENEYKCF